MMWFSYAVALLAAVAIIVIGLMYLFVPRQATLGFGLPLPEEGANIAWWLRLKGVRDIVSGLVVLALFAWSDGRTLGIVLLIESFTALGDMTLVLAARGAAGKAFGIHGVTAAVMIAAAVPMIVGLA